MNKQAIDTITNPFKIITPIALILLTAFLGLTGYFANGYLGEIISHMDKIENKLENFCDKTGLDIMNIDHRVTIIETKLK